MVEAARIKGFAERVQIARRKVCQLVGRGVKQRGWSGVVRGARERTDRLDPSAGFDFSESTGSLWKTALLVKAGAHRHEMCKLMTR
jgi:hypothetical protein